MTLRVSVVVPTYNRAHCIAECLESILAQTVPAHEILVSDDGSTDGTAAVLERFGARITVLLAPTNPGVSAARNAAIAQATGEWIAFLDSDDLWRPERLAILARDVGDAGPEIGVHMADLVLSGGGYQRSLFEQWGLVAPSDRAIATPDLLPFVHNGAHLQSVAVRRSVLAATGGFDRSLSIGEDALLLGRLVLATGWRITGASVAEVRRLGDDANALTVQAEKDPVTRIEKRLYYLEALLEAVSDPAHRRLLAKSKSHMLVQLAEARAGLGPTPRRLLLQAAAADPDRLRGMLRVLSPLVLGRRGFRLMRRNRTAAFRR
ncbi:MAG: glycosyltransferase family A protein [Pseudomonadota bacterium]